MAYRNNQHPRLYFFITAVITFIFLFSTVPYAQNPQPSPPAEQDIDTLTVSTNLVTVNVSVTHKQKPVQNLQASDFRLTDQGVPVTPQFFDTNGDASIIFVIDASASMRGEKWKRLKNGLKEFLKKEQRANYSLITFNEQSTLLVTSATTKDFWNAFISIKKPDGDTALYDGLALALNLSNSLPTRHKAIILLSDGDDNRSSTDLQTIRHEIYSHHVTLYPIGILLSKPEESPKEPAHGITVLTTLANLTGGVASFPTADTIEKTLSTIRNEINQQYSFSYAPPDLQPGWRSIHVELANNSNRLQLRYADRYFIPPVHTGTIDGQSMSPKQ